MIDASLLSLWDDFVASGSLEGALLLGCIAVLIILAAQIDSIVRACNQVWVHKHALARGRHKTRADAEAARTTIEQICARLPIRQQAVEALDEVQADLAPQAIEAKRARIRQIILSDIFISPGDRPFLARVRMADPGPEDPLAEEWRTGREMVLYAQEQLGAQMRFARRFPAERGYVVSDIVPFSFA